MSASPSAGAPAASPREQVAPSRAARWLPWLAVAFAAWLLWVPLERVVLMNDMLGYSSQGRALLTGDGNGARLDGQVVPGYYPAGMPALVAAAYALLGPDLRHSQVVTWLAALAVLALLVPLARRAAGPWGPLVAVLAVLASPAFRGAATMTLAQVPTSVLMLASALLFLRDDAPSLFAAGLVGGLVVLLRYAAISFPGSLALAGLLLARSRPAPWRSLFALGGGLALAGVLVLLHNTWAYGGPLATGYDAWGHYADGQFALSNIWAPKMLGNRGDESLLLRSFIGLGELYAPPVIAAALWGGVVMLRAGGPRRRLALLAVIVVVVGELFLASYPFRSEAYLVPTLPFVVLLGAAGVIDIAGRVYAQHGGLLAASAAVVLLLLSLRGGVAPRGPSEEEAIARRDSLQRAGQELEPEAALLTPSDFALVEPLVRTPSRRILYVGPFVSDVVEAAAMAEIEGANWNPQRVIPWVTERLREGRPVYLDQNPPPRGLAKQHKEVRGLLLDNFSLHATAIPGFFRIERKS